MTAIHITVINYCPCKANGQLPHKSTRVQLGNHDTIFFWGGGGHETVFERFAWHVT